MTAEDFLEFAKWKKAAEHYESKEELSRLQLELMAKKVCWAIERDQKRPGRVKIVDQEHAAELLDLAGDYLERKK
uniref:Uncharacterized protein n=1 Tax=Dulem virus 34 TaxID=3145752 RepID=A0AAU8B6R9_9CAUD